MAISITITVLITEENQSLIFKFDFSFWKRRKNTSTLSSPSYLWPTASFEVLFLYILIKDLPLCFQMHVVSLLLWRKVLEL